MKEIPFKPEHVELVEIRGEDKGICTEENLRNVAQHPSSTFILDGRPIAFAGIVMPGDGVGYVWLLPTVYFREHFIGVAKAMCGYVSELPSIFKLHELQTSGHKDKRVVRWLKFLGFQYDKENDIYSKVV